MTISSSKLAEALRAVLPFATAVAEDPHHVDYADATAAAGTASLVLASYDAEQSTPTPDDIRRDRIQAMDQVLNEGPRRAGLINAAHLLLTIVSARRALTPEEVVLMDGFLQGETVGTKYVRWVQNLFGELREEQRTGLPAESTKGCGATSQSAQIRKAGAITLDQLINNVPMGAGFIRGVYALRVGLAEGRNATEDDLITLNSVRQYVPMDAERGATIARLYEDLLAERTKELSQVSSADAESQARALGWANFEDSEDANLLVVAHDDHNVHFDGPTAWQEALAWHKANVPAGTGEATV